MDIQETGREIVTTLQNADNESTESPWWILIDPKRIIDLIENHPRREKVDVERVIYAIAGSIEGPFFSRSDADEYLAARRYEYSDLTKVYCSSGYWSRKYKNFCRAVDPGVNFRRIKNVFQAPKTVRITSDTKQDAP